ncbi:hypothetical protein [Actinomyces sp.]
MSSGEMQVTYAKWEQWKMLLRDGENAMATKLANAANLLRDNIKLQNEGKWSSESGPQAFATKYAEYLTQEADALDAMANNARAFVDAIEETMRNFGEDQEGAAKALNEKIKDIPAIYVSQAKQQALDEFLQHPSQETFDNYQGYLY